MALSWLFLSSETVVHLLFVVWRMLPLSVNSSSPIPNARTLMRVCLSAVVMWFCVYSDNRREKSIRKWVAALNVRFVVLCVCWKKRMGLLFLVFSPLSLFLLLHFRSRVQCSGAVADTETAGILFPIFPISCTIRCKGTIPTCYAHFLSVYGHRYFVCLPARDDGLFS